MRTERRRATAAMAKVMHLHHRPLARVEIAASADAGGASTEAARQSQAGVELLGEIGRAAASAALRAATALHLADEFVAILRVIEAQGAMRAQARIAAESGVDTLLLLPHYATVDFAPYEPVDMRALAEELRREPDERARVERMAEVVLSVLEADEEHALGA